MGAGMKCYIHNSQKELSITPIKQKIVQIAASVVALERNKTSYNKVNLYFVSDAKMRKIHNEFFNDPSSTDCISFPLDDPEDPLSELSLGGKILGEIFVCPKTAIEYAAKHKKNPYDELALYIVHGLLHLLGYDDIAKDERKKMRKAEKKHLQILTSKGIIPLLS